MTPDALEPPELGRLVWDEKFSWFEGSTRLGAGEGVRIMLSPFNDVVPPYPTVLEEPVAFLEGCIAFVSAVSRRVDELKLYLASEMLETYNTDWRMWNEGGVDVETPEIDAATFVSRLTVRSIHAEHPDAGEVEFDDGEMFWGHHLFVSTDWQGTPTHCSMFG